MSILDEIESMGMDSCEDEFGNSEEQAVNLEKTELLSPSEAEVEAFVEQYQEGSKEFTPPQSHSTRNNYRNGEGKLSQHSYRSRSRTSNQQHSYRSRSRTPNRQHSYRSRSRTPNQQYSYRSRSRTPNQPYSYRSRSRSSSNNSQSRSRPPDEVGFQGKGKGKGRFRGANQESYGGKGKGERGSQNHGKGSYNKDSNPIRKVCAFYNTSNGCKNGSNCGYLHNVNLLPMNNVHRCPNPNCTNSCIGKQCSVCHCLQKEAKYPKWKFKESSYMEKQSKLKMCPECNINKCMGLRCRQCHFYCVQQKD
jgi:hypothetical protein